MNASREQERRARMPHVVKPNHRHLCCRDQLLEVSTEHIHGERSAGLVGEDEVVILPESTDRQSVLKLIDAMPPQTLHAGRG